MFSSYNEASHHLLKLKNRANFPVFKVEQAQQCRKTSRRAVFKELSQQREMLGEIFQYTKAARSQWHTADEDFHLTPVTSEEDYKGAD